MVSTNRPTRLREALELRASGTLIPYAGGTDLMVGHGGGAEYLFLDRVEELRIITADADSIRIGAACTFAEVLESGLTPAILKEAVKSIGAPAIRNVGTVGGNICNGSPKADSALVFFVTDSKLRLASAGGERIVSLTDFYLGRKKTALRPDELLVEIVMPKRGTRRVLF